MLAPNAGSMSLLVLTNREDYTADFLILELLRRGVTYHRFNVEDYPRLVDVTVRFDQGFQGSFHFVSPESEQLRFDQISSIWLRRPEWPVPEPLITDPTSAGFALDESQEFLESLWEALDCFWVSPPSKLKVA